MTISAICAGLKKMPKDADVEILLHPGRAEYKEEGYWDDRPELKRYYRSVDRKEEGDVLQSSKIRTFLRSSL